MSEKCREGLINHHPAFEDARQVLGELFLSGKVAPEFCTESLKKEIQLKGRAELNKQLKDAEQLLNFPEVEKLFRVIATETVTVVIDEQLRDDLDAGRKVDWQLIQEHSVQIYTNRVLDFGVRDIPYAPGLKAWTLDYDDFLGYMAGVLPLLQAQATAFIG